MCDTDCCFNYELIKMDEYRSEYNCQVTWSVWFPALLRQMENWSQKLQVTGQGYSLIYIGRISNRQLLSTNIRKRICGHVRPAKIQIRLSICAVWSESSLDAFWIVSDARFVHAGNEDSLQTARMRLRSEHISKRPVAPRLIVSWENIVLFEWKWSSTYMIYWW